MNDLEIQQLCATNALAWADLGKLKLGGSIFQTVGYEFLFEPYMSQARRLCVCKCTQGGFTQFAVIRSLHRTIFRVYPKGVLYLFPTRDDVTDFSSSRFKPMIVDNPDLIGKHMAETDRSNLKRIGDAFIYFRGGRLGNVSDGGVKKAQQLKSIPADLLVCDEMDEMDQDAIPIALQRLADSELKEEVYLGNPTIPDYGIDRQFQMSDQRYWHIKCQAGGHETCLEIEFPNCLSVTAGKQSGPNLVINTATAGRVFKCCVKCGKEIYTRDGRWVPSYPELSEYMHGYSISHLNMRNQDPAEILKEFSDATERNDQKALTQVYNLRLGKSYIATEHRLRVNDVLACCGHDPMLVSHNGPCCAGVDVGSLLNVVIGYKVANEKRKIVKVAQVSSFNDVHDLFTRFHVRSAVFDLMPEQRKVREFCESHPFQCFGCTYAENQSGVAVWDERSKTVRVNRTEILDATHNLCVSPGRLELPRLNDELQIFAKQMCNTAKILREDKDTGAKKYVYKGKIGGQDDYRHAMNYFELAAMRVQPIIQSSAMSYIETKIPHYYG